MSRLKSLVAAAFAAVSAVLTHSAVAATVSAGIPLVDGPMFQTVTLWLQPGAQGAGQTLTAVGRVEAIHSSAGATVWQSTPSTPELTMLLSGFSAISEFGIAEGLSITTFTAGTLRLYADPARNSNPTTGAIDPSSFADGSLFLDLVPQSLSGTGAATTTLIAVSSRPGGGAPDFISASGAFNVVGGAAASFFDTNQYASVSGADLLFNFSVGLQPAALGWDYRGSAQLGGTSAVPLPGSLLMLVSALAPVLLRHRRGQPMAA